MKKYLTIVLATIALVCFIVAVVFMNYTPQVFLVTGNTSDGYRMYYSDDVATWASIGGLITLIGAMIGAVIYGFRNH